MRGPALRMSTGQSSVPAVAAAGDRSPAGIARDDVSLSPLVRLLHEDGKRHCYSVGSAPDTTVLRLLGGVRREPTSEWDQPVWLSDEGLLCTRGCAPSRSRARPLAAARWVGSPLRWREWASLVRRVGMVARRAVQTPRYLLAGPPGGSARTATGPQPVGYLHTSPGPGRRALFAASHAVTGDQLLTLWPEEASKLGYESAAEIGYIAECSADDVGLSGRLSDDEVELPWAWRYGDRARALRSRELSLSAPTTSKVGGSRSSVQNSPGGVLNTGSGRAARTPRGGSLARGKLEPNVSQGQLLGWARTTDGSHRSAIVELVVDGEVVATDTADRPHPTAGRFGCAFALPPAAFEPGEHQLCMRVQGDEHLLGAPIAISNQYDKDQPLQSALQSLELNLAVEGWVFDRSSPDERFTVSRVHRQVWVGDMESKNKRADLAGKGFSDGCLAYRLEIPERFFDRGDTPCTSWSSVATCSSRTADGYSTPKCSHVASCAGSAAGSPTSRTCSREGALNRILLSGAQVRDREVVNEAVAGVDVVAQLAADTRVTDSIDHPSRNFDVTVFGTFTILDARGFRREPGQWHRRAAQRRPRGARAASLRLSAASGLPQP